MSATTLPRDAALLPRPPGGMGRGALLAVAVHLLLLAALTFGVHWRASEPEGVSAELWSAVPQIAAPAEVEPPPPVEPPKPAPRVVQPPPREQQRDAEIAIEKERQKKLQQQREAEQREREKAAKDKAEREKAAKEKDKAEADKRQQAEEALRNKLREEQLKRIMGQAGATGAPTATGNATRDAGPSASYAGRIAASILPNIVLTEEVRGNPEALVEVRVAPDGTILSRRLIRSSGSAAWDEAVLRAVDRTDRIPRDVDGRVIPVFPISFRPDQVRR